MDNIIDIEYDVRESQANLRTVQKVNKLGNKDYKYFYKKQLNKVYKNLPKEKAKELIFNINEVNEYATAKPY